ncbi:unnamed protein product, partial [Medioppia subpectinata]
MNPPCTDPKEVDAVNVYQDDLIDYYTNTECHSYPYLQKQLCQLVDTPPPAKPLPVDITLYYEYKCGPCRREISTQIAPAFEKLKSIMNVNFFPYGLSQWHQWTKLCAVESESADKYVPFIGCVMGSKDVNEPAIAAQQCANKVGLDMTTINECAYGPLGRGLMLRAYEKDIATKPDVQYVPW